MQFWCKNTKKVQKQKFSTDSHVILCKFEKSHIDSIHSPQRKTIMKLCMKSVKFQRGIIFCGNRSTLSETPAVVI